LISCKKSLPYWALKRELGIFLWLIDYEKGSYENSAKLLALLCPALPGHAPPRLALPSRANPCLDDNISIDYEMPQKIKAL
jgi:hypothetical protein